MQEYKAVKRCADKQCDSVGFVEEILVENVSRAVACKKAADNNGWFVKQEFELLTDETECAYKINERIDFMKDNEFML